MTTKTIYVKDENAETWRRAEQYIKLYERQSLSEYLFEHLEKLVKRYEPIADELDELNRRIDELKKTTEEPL